MCQAFFSCVLLFAAPLAVLQVGLNHGVGLFWFDVFVPHQKQSHVLAIWDIRVGLHLGLGQISVVFVCLTFGTTFGCFILTSNDLSQATFLAHAAVRKGRRPAVPHKKDISMFGKLSTLHYTGWLIGVRIYNGVYQSLYHWVVSSPTYPKQPGVFFAELEQYAASLLLRRDSTDWDYIRLPTSTLHWLSTTQEPITVFA